MNKKTVLRFIAVMIIGLLLVPSKVSGAAAKSGKWGSNLKWSFSGGVLTISGKGDMDAKAFVGASKSSDPRNLAITKVVIKEGVTSVCDNAFSYQKKLKKVTLPSSIKAVGREAFNGCRKLTTVNFPKNIETIGGFAFAETALKKVKLPEKLKTLKYNAFSDCTGLKTVTFNKKLEKIESAAFMNTAIKAVRLPASLTEIAASALSGCPALGTIKVDPGNKSYLVNNGILFSKDKTRLILYPAKKKGNTYTVPKNIAVIENCAFIDAVSIRSFEVEKGNKNYTSENGVIFSPDMKKLVKYPAAAGTVEYTVPESVTEIGTNAFYNSMAEKVTLPSGLTTIGWGAFEKSKKLKEITVPDNVTIIMSGAFMGCSSLKRATVGDGVQYLESFAFCDCPKLEEITIGKSLKAIDDKAFQNDTGLKTVVINSDQLNAGHIAVYSFDNINPKAVIRIKTSTQDEFDRIKARILSTAGGMAPKTVTVERIN